MVQNEFEVFEASGKRLANIQTLYEALLTTQPTSLKAIQYMWFLCYKILVMPAGFHNRRIVVCKECDAEMNIIYV